MPLLVLPGALGIADGGGAVARMLEPARPVVHFDYGSEDRVGPLLGRAVAAMDAAGADRFDILGVSIGGWFAQCLAARHPSRVRRIVLAHSFVLRGGDAWRFRLALRLWPLLPERLLRAGIRARGRRALRPLRTLSEDGYRAVLRQIEAKLAERAALAALAAQQEVILDSLSPPPPKPDAAMPILIIEPEDDALIGPGDRARLRRHFPDARVVRLEGAGHIGALVRPRELAEAVDRFLR